MTRDYEIETKEFLFHYEKRAPLHVSKVVFGWHPIRMSGTEAPCGVAQWRCRLLLGEGERLQSLHPSWEGARSVRHMGQPRLVSSWGFMDCSKVHVEAVRPLLH